MVAVVFDYGISEKTEKNIFYNIGLESDKVKAYKIDILAKNNSYKLPDNIKRCVFITPLPSGLMQYHYQFTDANKHVVSWIFSIYDVQNEPYRKSYREQLDALFSKKNVSYDIFFPKSDDFSQVQKACLRPIKEKLMLCIFSKNDSLGEEVRKTLQQFIPEWEIKSGDDSNDADAMIVVGENESDFDIESSEKRHGRRYVWINKTYYDFSVADREEYLASIEQILLKNKWEFADFERICFCSSIWQEKLGYQYKNGEISEAGLRNNDNFVVWDEYGLPILPEDYTAEKLTDFFEKNCCFYKIAYELS